MATIIGVKGFNKDMKCRGFQYEEGKEYDEPIAKACGAGFHFCENPIDVLRYYDPNSSVYHKVEGSGDIDRDGSDSKIACTHIKIGARIDIVRLCKLTFDYVKSKCTNEYNAEPGKPVTAGDGEAATAGNYGAATAGESGAATAGDFGTAASRGKTSVGENGLAVVRGNDVLVRGGLGAILVIAEENTFDNDIKDWKAVVVDNETIKADTWYKLEDGELVEAEIE